MTKITIIRHGETDANKQMIVQGRLNNPLNSTGISQAIQAAKYFRHHFYQFDVIVSSPFIRALKTAQLIKEELKLPLDIHEESELIERNFGEYDGKKIQDDYQEQVYFNLIPGMEKNHELEHRVITSLTRIALEHQNKHVLVVAHSHVIKALLVQMNIGFEYKTFLANCAISTLEFDQQTHQFLVIHANTSPF